MKPDQRWGEEAIALASQRIESRIDTELQLRCASPVGDLDDSGLAITGAPFHLWEVLASASVRGDQYMQKKVAG